MKKIIFSFILIFLVFINTKVNALTNTGKIYEVFYGQSGVNVFAKDMTYNSMDYNGWMLVSDSDNYIYYCIDPSKYMQNINDAISNTHTIIEGDSNILNRLNISEANLNRVKLLAYYGYGYKDNYVDHTNKKWYGITQILIWRTVRSDINFQFKTSRYGNVNSGLFFNEISELMKLVYNHNLQPSFNNNEITLKTGQQVTLTDNNNVLSYYNIENNAYASFEIKDNKLIITAKKSGTVTTSLYRQKVDNNFSLLTSNTFQSIIIRGKINTYESNFKLNITDGLLNLKKVNEDNKFTNDLINSKISIYDTNNNFVKDISITKEVEEIKLDYGNYYAIEKEASLSYQINPNKYYFSITKENNIAIIVIPNKKIKGNVLITKKDSTTKKTISNTIIGIFNEDGTLLNKKATNVDGIIYLENMLYGKYYLQELESAKYYRLNNNKIYFEIKDNNETIRLEMYNEKKSGKINIIKKDQITNETLKDAMLSIYDDTNTLVYESMTSDNGEIESILPAGKYYVLETKAPYGYIRNKDKIYFELTEEQEVIEIIITNKKIEMPNTYKENNIFIIELINILLILLFITKRKYEKI